MSLAAAGVGVSGDYVERRGQHAASGTRAVGQAVLDAVAVHAEGAQLRQRRAPQVDLGAVRPLGHQLGEALVVEEGLFRQAPRCRALVVIPHNVVQDLVREEQYHFDLGNL